MNVIRFLFISNKSRITDITALVLIGKQNVEIKRKTTNTTQKNKQNKYKLGLLD